jgi:RNA polymerase sigma factor (sigma-70 family)
VLTIEVIAKRNNEWVKMAAYLGAESPEDIVQDMYLKLCENITLIERIEHKEGEVNTFYIFTILRSKIVDAHRKTKREHYDELLFDPILPPDDSEREYEGLMTNIKTTIDKMSDYDQMLLELHFVYKLSMREIEKRTGIPLHSIFNRLMNAKNLIKYENYGKYQSYCEAVTEKETIARVGRYDSQGNEGNWY